VDPNNQSLLTIKDRNMLLNERDVNLLGESYGALFSQGERDGSIYSIHTTESKRVSQYGQGYVILIKNHKQNAHREGIC
jgi:hypothetical protein